MNKTPILEEERAADENTKKKKPIIKVAISFICIVIAFVIVLTTFIIPNGKYNDALALMDEGKYTEAVAIFEEISGYKDSDQKVEQALYLQATELQNNEEYEEAIKVFESVKNYKDSGDRIIECKNVIAENKYIKAVALMNEKNYSEALNIFEELNEYKESKSNAITCIKTLAEQCVANGDVDGAISWYTKCDDVAAVKEVKYNYILKHKNNTDTKTYEYLKELMFDKYKDTEKIYTDLYSSVSVDLFFNADYSDKTTRLTTMKLNKSFVMTIAYYHYQITGGYPGQVFKFKIVKEEKNIDGSGIGEYESERGEEVKASEGVNSFPVSVSVGKYYKITIYDSETGKKLASATLTVPDNQSHF